VCGELATIKFDEGVLVCRSRFDKNGCSKVGHVVQLHLDNEPLHNNESLAMEQCLMATLLVIL